MTEQNAMQLKEQLLSLGFETLVSEVDFTKIDNQKNITIYHAREIFDDQLMYVLYFEKNARQDFELSEYILRIRHIPIPEQTIRGINTKELENKVIKAEDIRNQHRESPITDKELLQQIKDADETLLRLVNTKGKGSEIAQLIMFKHWPQEEWERFIKDEKKLIEKYESQLRVIVKNGHVLSAEEAYEVVKKKVGKLSET